MELECWEFLNSKLIHWEKEEEIFFMKNKKKIQTQNATKERKTKSLVQSIIPIDWTLV